MVPDPLWWFRTCEAFGATRGHDFARRFTDFFGGRAAGHTYIIGLWQSGLHSLRAGESRNGRSRRGCPEGQPSARSRRCGRAGRRRTRFTFFRPDPEGY